MRKDEADVHVENKDVGEFGHFALRITSHVSNPRFERGGFHEPGAWR